MVAWSKTRSHRLALAQLRERQQEREHLIARIAGTRIEDGRTVLREVCQVIAG
jgi:hypothetical protein